MGLLGTGATGTPRTHGVCFDYAAGGMDLTTPESLVLRTPRLTLRFPSEPDLRELAQVAQRGVHRADQMPFYIPWTDPSPSFIDEFLAYHRTLRDSWHVDAWRLELAVFLQNQPIGVQVVHAARFAQQRITGSGSWLGLPWHGHGYGTEMRTAALCLAFCGLGARAALSGAFADNVASARVSTKLGMNPTGRAGRRCMGRRCRRIASA